MSNEMTEAEKKAFGEKVRSLSFSRGKQSDNRQAEKRLDGDMAAYKRLRADGEQPPEIRGSANLEAHATSTHEIKAGHIVKDKKALAAVGAVLDQAKGK